MSNHANGCGIALQGGVCTCSGLAQGALTPLGRAELQIDILKNALGLQEEKCHKLSEINARLDAENIRIGQELRASEVTYGTYIDGLHKEIKQLKAANEHSRHEIGKLRGAAVTPAVGPANFVSLGDAMRNYQQKQNQALQAQQPEKIDYISFKNGEGKEIRYFEVFFTDIANERVINYRQTNGKNLGINASSIRYIEEQ